VITIFTTAKAFLGHSGVIQRNALRSWTLLHPDVEVILFGDEEGAAEIARELGVRHEPNVRRHPSGLKYINSMFDRARDLARHNVLCYANCDIILTPDILDAARRVSAQKQEFLIVGRRWDTDVTDALDFSNPRWDHQIRDRALAANRRCDEWWTDYFVFPRDLYYKNIPDFVIGRTAWDGWLTWWPKHRGAALVDASEVVCAIHQNHDYGYHPQGKQGVWSDELARQNFNLAGGFWHLRSIKCASYRLTADKLLHNSNHYFAHGRFIFERHTERLRGFVRTNVWHPLLNFTRPVRHALAIKQKHAGPLYQRPKSSLHWLKLKSKLATKRKI
jgi:hypothetical protein